MVTRMTTDKDRLATFMTAPPIITLVQNSRFRAPRNLPYRGAPSYKASIYYWWWEFLKRNCKYQSTCKRLGRGKLAKLYRDFGNIFEHDFLTWWRSHQGLFAEQNPLIDHKRPAQEDGAILYKIDPKRPLSQIQEEIKALHLWAHAIMPPDTPRATSSALYPIHTNVSAHTLHKVLTVWDLRCAQPDQSAYDLGLLAGFKANMLPSPKFGETRTRLALDTDAHNKRSRISIANQVNRYLRTASQYIENVGRGEFPKAERR